MPEIHNKNGVKVTIKEHDRPPMVHEAQPQEATTTRHYSDEELDAIWNNNLKGATK